MKPTQTQQRKPASKKPVYEILIGGKWLKCTTAVELPDGSLHFNMRHAPCHPFIGTATPKEWRRA